MQNQKTLQNFLKNNGLDAMLLSSESNIRYLTSYTGFSPLERDAHVLITSKNIYLFTSPLYSNEVKKQIKNVEIVENSNDNSFYKNLAEIILKEKLENIGFENDSVTVAEYLRLTAQISSHLVAKDFSELRIKKTSNEIKTIQAACKIGDKAFLYIQKFLKPGITELGLAWEMEKYIKELGADLAFPTIIAFGKNSAVPHHKTNDQRLKANDVVLLDFGVKVDGYCSDMSRTLIIGQTNKEQERVYAAVKTAQGKAVEFIQKKLMEYSSSEVRSLDKDKNSSRYLSNNNAILASEVDKVARDYIVSQGYPSIPHSLGHGIGIAVHESPRLSPTSKDILEEGMVFSIEPGVYLNNKFGVRIEDLYTIQNSKLVQLTHSKI